MDSNTIVILIAVVAGVSFVFSMLGLGGGVIYVPLFYWLGLDLKTEAIPLALCFNFSTQASASYSFIKKSMVERRIVAPMLVAVLLVPIPAVYLLHLVPVQPLIIAFALLLLTTSLLLVLRRSIQSRNADEIKLHPGLLGAGAGAGGGLMAGLLGVGGGSVIVPSLMLAGIPEKRSVATAALGVTCASAAALIGHIPSADWRWQMLLLMGVSMATSQLGSRFMIRRLNPHILRIMLASVLLLVAGKLLLDAF